MLKLLILLSTILLFSCGKEVPNSKAVIKFTAGAAGGATQTGGVLVIGRSANGGPGRFSLPLNNELDSTEVNIPYGQWEIAAVSWDGASKLEGTVRCGRTPSGGIPIDKEAMIVPLTLNTTNCNEIVFGEAATKTTGQPKTLEFFNCAMQDAFFNDPVSASHCANNGGVGTVGSFRINFKAFDPVFGPAPTTILESACQTSITGGNKATSLKIPFFASGAMVPMEVKLFHSTNCSGPMKVYHFDNGHQFPVGINAKFGTNGSMGNFLNVNFNVCDFFDPSHPSGFPSGFNASGANFICNPSHFNSIATKTNGGSVSNTTEFHIMKDLNFSGVSLTPIGTSDNRFNGKIIGNDRTLSNMTLAADCTNTTDGFFKYVDAGAEFQDLKIVNASITEGTIVDYGCTNMGFIGYAKVNSNGLKIKGVEVDLDVTGYNHIGSLVGYLHASTSCSSPACKVEISNTSASGTVTGRDNVGGVAGKFYAVNTNVGFAVETEFSGTVSGKYNIGGIAGSAGNIKMASVKAFAPSANPANNLIEMAPISGTSQNVGGIVGQANPVTINKATAIGKIIATDSGCSTNCSYMNVGGIIGGDSNQITEIYNSWSDTDIIGNGDAHGGIAGYLGSQTSKIQYSHAYGDVTTLTSTTTSNYGGIVGLNYGKILDSFYSLGTVKAQSQVGGIVGHNTSNANDDSIYGEVSNVFIDNATVEGSVDIGGIVGKNEGKVTNSYTSAVVNLTDAYLSPSNIGGIAGSNIRNSSGNSEGVLAEVSNSVSYGTIVQVSGSTFTSVNGLVGGLSGTSGADYLLTNSSFVNAMTGTFNFSGSTSSFTCGSNIDCTTFFSVSGGNAVHKLKDEVDYFEDAGNFLPTPIMIDTVAKWNAIGDNPILMSKHFKLNSNIIFPTTTNDETVPIGSTTHPFIGFFEGDNNYTVYSPSITKTSEDNVALFRVVGDESYKIAGYIGEPDKPLTIDGSEIKGVNNVATLVGNLVEGEVSAIVTNGTVTAYFDGASPVSSIGGIVGYLGSMTSTSNTAGIYDSSYHGNVENNGSTSKVGGIVGEMSAGRIENVIAKGEFYATDKVGGVVGSIESSSGSVTAEIVNAEVKKMASGDTIIESSTGDAGGLIGSIDVSNLSLEVSKVNIDGVSVQNLTSGNLGFVIGYIGSVTVGSINLSDTRIVNSSMVQTQSDGTSFSGSFVGLQNSSIGTGNISIYDSYVSNSTADVSGSASFDPIVESDASFTFYNVHYDNSVTLASGADGTMNDNSGHSGVTYHILYSGLVNNFQNNYVSLDGQPFSDKWFIDSNGSLLLTP